MEKAKILVVDDESRMRKLVSDFLHHEGYAVVEAEDGEKAVDIFFERGDIALIILDVMMPKMDGWQVCREIRQKSTIPVIVLTSRNNDFDELMSLNTGADDYISKPYNAQVLLARIQKLLERTYDVQDNATITYKGLTLNVLKAEISYKEQSKALTKNEMGILRMLMMNKGNIIPRDAIIDELWQSEEFIDENTLNVNIVRLRKTLAEIGLPDYLKTKRGLGYCI